MHFVNQFVQVSDDHLVLMNAGVSVANLKNQYDDNPSSAHRQWVK